MKILNAALIVALTLTSGIVLAERGSDKDNRIISPESSPAQHDDSETQSFSPSDVLDRNS